MGIAENLEKVQNRIRAVCEAVGRDPNTVRLLAASKRTDAEGIRQSIALGHVLFGENRAQALRDKFDEVAPEHPEAQWHFIGYLQRNKVKYIVGRASMLHSLDSLDLAEAISDRIDHLRSQGQEIAPMKVLVQVKLGDEESKTGLEADAVLPFCQQLQAMPNIALCGLMNIAPLAGTPKEWFTQVAELAEKGRQMGLPLHELSMGMSGDLEEAIACGATMVRIGSDIYWAQ